MIETILSQSMRRIFAGGAVLGLSLSAFPVHAQLAEQNQQTQAQQPMQRVEITGSSIRRLPSESALPITTIDAEEFSQLGLVTAQEVLASIPMNQSSVGASQSVGAGTGGQAVADLRGLGGDKTLVLLNGRRMANHPFFADTVDLNLIPLAALERVEILRDGASAIYGTDAIGGVVNFITKRSFQGREVSVHVYEPLDSGGGDEGRINFTGGWGDLDQDGHNLLAVIDLHRQSSLLATDRDFSRTGVIPERGISRTSGVPFPANFFSDNGIVGNPYFATGCLPPASIPSTTNSTCRFDYTRFIDNIPLTEQENYLLRYSRRMGQDHTGTIDFLHSRSTNTSRVAPPPLAGIGLIMDSSSPFYPGAGVTPAFPRLTGENLDIFWRPLVTGKREQFDVSESDRLLASMDGTFRAWDYSSGLMYARGRASSAFTGGYVIDSRMVEGVREGILNPFGEQTAAGAEFLQQSLLKGTFLQAEIETYALDAKASTDLAQLPAGPLGFALGGEVRYDDASYNVNRALASQASSSGYADAQDQGGSRTISAIYTEVNIPVIKGLEVNLAARYDYYDDVGGNFNPKLAIRYQPTPQILMRGSYNEGFRVPTLYDLYGPQTITNTARSYDDPLLCPDGTAVPVANPILACKNQQKIRQGGNPNVEPETSETFSIGAVFEPSRSLMLSLDYWDIELKDQISTVDETRIFGDFAKYRDRFVYNAAGTELNYVIANIENLGEVHTRGVDLGMRWTLPRNRWGNLVLNVEGTYVDQYDYQNERGGEFIHNAGRYGDERPVFRWRHTASLTWTKGPWTSTLSNRYLSDYDDQNQEQDLMAPEFAQEVDAYSIWSLAATYKGNDRAQLTMGIKNLADEDPPFSNQGRTFQQGYDPRFTDPLGRTIFVQATYRF